MTQESTENSQVQTTQKAGDAWWLRILKGIWFVLSLFGRVFRILLIVGLVLGLLAGVVYSMQLDEQVRAQFEGKRWALPARVFARPLDVYVGQQVFPDHLEQELKLLNYVEVDEPVETGQYKRTKSSFSY